MLPCGDAGPDAPAALRPHRIRGRRRLLRCGVLREVPCRNRAALGGRPPQQNGAARDDQLSVSGDFARDQVILRGENYTLSRPQRRLLHRRVVSDRQPRRTPHRLHAGQSPYPALPDHAARRPHPGSAAQLGHPAAAVVPQLRYRRPGRERRDRSRSSGIRAATRATSARKRKTSTPIRWSTRPRWHGFRRQLRALPRSGQRPRRALLRSAESPRDRHETSCCRRVSTPPATRWSARNAIRSATSSCPASKRATIITTTSCPSSNSISPSIKIPAYWPDGRTRRFSTDAFGLWQSQCFLKGGVTCVRCHVDAHDTSIEKSPQLRPDDAGHLHAVPYGYRQSHARAHASSGEERGQFVRGVPHAAHGAEHQSEDPRPLHYASRCPRIRRTTGSRTPATSATPTATPRGRRSGWTSGGERLRAPNRSAAPTRLRRPARGIARQFRSCSRSLRTSEEGPFPRANALGYLSRFGADPRVFPIFEWALGDSQTLPRIVAALRMPAGSARSRLPLRT